MEIRTGLSHEKLGTHGYTTVMFANPVLELHPETIYVRFCIIKSTFKPFSLDLEEKRIEHEWFQPELKESQKNRILAQATVMAKKHAEKHSLNIVGKGKLTMWKDGNHCVFQCL